MSQECFCVMKRIPAPTFSSPTWRIWASSKCRKTTTASLFLALPPTPSLLFLVLKSCRYSIINVVFMLHLILSYFFPSDIQKDIWYSSWKIQWHQALFVLLIWRQMNSALFVWVVVAGLVLDRSRRYVSKSNNMAGDPRIYFQFIY